MNTNNVKNMLVLKNIPSNLVDEAIIILKNNIEAKKLEKIDKNEDGIQEESKKANSIDSDYIVKEAELIVNNYIDKIESKEKEKRSIKNRNNQKSKLLLLKTYAIVATLTIIVELILLVLK